jgi:PAS domain S-box-containing protein
MAIAPEPLAMRRIERATEAYESLFGDADVALFVLAEGILECNDAACRLLGRRRDDLLGRSPLTFSPPLQPDGRDSAAAARERVASALAGLPQAFQWQFEDRDGAPVEALLRMEAVRLDGATRLLLQVRDLSHLWRAEQALQDTQARLAQILDNANALVFAKDRDGRYLFANRRFQCLLRKREHEILGHNDEDLFGLEMARGYRATDLQVLEAGEARQYEETARLNDGVHTYLSLKFPLLDRRGEPYAVCGIATDITDRKRVEDALRDAALAVSTAEGGAVFRELSRYLAAILDCDVTFIATFGPDRQTMRTLALWVDGALRENIDYDLEGTPCRLVVGREFQFYPERLTELFPADNMFAQMGVRAYAAFPLNDSAGQPLGLVAVVSRRPLGSRAFIESVLKIFAARAAAEIERQRADEARRRSEASYRSIFEASEDAIFIHDWDTGAIVDVNPRACRMYGYSRDEMLRLTVGDLSSGEHPYTEAEAARWIEKAKQGERVQVEWRRRNKDGSLHWDEVILCRADIAGRPHILAITREITERKAAEERLKASEEQYRDIFNGSADALVLWNSELRRVDVNPAYERIYGLTRDEVLTGGHADPLPPEERIRRDDIIRRSLAGETCHVELESRRKNGERFLAEVRTIPIQHRGQPHALAICRDITERRTAEERLRSSEEQYRAMFNASVDGLLLWDADHRIVDVNEAFLALHGFRREDLVGRTDPVFIPADLQEQCAALLPEILGGKPCHIEARTQRKDGTQFDVEIHGIPMHYQGRPHVLIILRDISQRKEHEARLRASEEQYRAMFNASADALMLWNSRIERVDVNPAHEKIFGFTREEVVGRGFDGLPYPEELAQPRVDMVRRALAGETCREELDALRKDGRRIVTELRTIPFLHQGEPHVLQIARDITEARHAREELRDSEERYRLLFEMESDAIILADAATLQHIDANRAAVELYGYPRDELLRLRSTDLSAEPSKTQTAMTIGAGTVRVPMRWHRKKDGTVFPVEITANFFDLHGRRIMLAAIRDITERKRAEEQRARLETQLRQAQKMEAIGQLTGGIAHDFNNILTSVMGYIALAADRSDGAGDERLARYLGQASAACTRARDLIQQMLTFSRGQRGEPRALRLAPLVEESVKLLRSSLPATIDIATDLDEHAPPALLDPVQLDQVLLNLCINARDAMPDGGRIGVTVRAETLAGGVCTACRGRLDGRFVALAVTDTGHGITPEVLDRMFEPFFSTKEVGKGSGMGLAMVHGIVHDHGGHIQVSSRPSAGAEFRILFPALGADAAGAAASQARDSRSARRPALRGRVLVAEDEPMVAEFMGELLTGWGLEVTLAADGAEARDLFAGDPEHFDLVVTDQTMPRLTGLELARVLARLRPGVPVVLYTGYGEDLAAGQLEAAGVRALVKKPVDPAELLALLKTHLPARRTGR